MKKILLSLLTLLILSGCSTWYHYQEYYCVEWVTDYNEDITVYALKIKPSEISKWEKLHQEGICGPITGPYTFKK